MRQIAIVFATLAALAGAATATATTTATAADTAAAVAVAVAGPDGPAAAAPVTGAREDTGRGRFIPELDPSVVTAGMLEAHPDLAGRQRGMDALLDGRPDDALREFRRGAHYGDKPSQAMLGELHWTGQGTPVDRVAGYLWMFLAAERGYHEFQVWAQVYWEQLDPAERAEVAERGPALRADYGDAATGPRLARVLRRERQRGTGSMLDASGQGATITAYEGGKPVAIDGRKFYAKENFDATAYRGVQDRLWTAPLDGRVDVGEVEKVEEPNP
ncbi:sel1 repeat family protein [Luteimonas sp. MJ246]|uniref:sel1 repeat family protein n=1 Tax=Luteimonas sp. MJ174 TaxID=3129237 RepID=UPI0031BB1BBB